MKTIIDIGVLCVTVLMMLAVGLDLEVRHFREVAWKKRTLVLTLVCQATLLPALGLALTRVMALPPLAGMAARRFIPEFAAKHARTIRNLSLADVAGLIVFVMTAQYDRLAADWQLTALASTVFMAAAMAAGLIFSRVQRFRAYDSMTVGIVFAVRNVGLASAIAITLLNRVEYAVFAAVYFLTEVPILLAAVEAYRHWWPTVRQTVQPAEAKGNL